MGNLKSKIQEELNLKPGPKVGQILQKPFEEVDEDLSKNNKEFLLKRVRELNSKSNPRKSSIN